MASAPNRLLVVDDDPDICEFMSEVAEGLGFAVEAAGDPTSFQSKIQSFSPTVIVMDLQMPEADGIELLRKLGQMRSQAHVIVASGMDTRVLSTAEQLGATQGLQMLGSLQKPIMLPDLEAMLDKARRVERRITESALAEAISAGQIDVYYQPKATRKSEGVWVIEGAEALARWKHPEYGMVLPGEFIPLAEKTGLIAPLTDFVFQAAMEQSKIWSENGLPLTLAINLSAQLLTDLLFPDRLALLLEEYEVEPSWLMLELTESGAMSDPALTMDILTRLRVKDIGLSIDDFGTGYHSLTQLYRMPFSELKIHTSFVLDVCDTEEARTIVDSMIYLAQKLKMSACAEGVESHEVLDFLDKAGCDKAQGFLISRPVPARDLEGVVREWNSGQQKRPKR